MNYRPSQRTIFSVIVAVIVLLSAGYFLLGSPGQTITSSNPSWFGVNGRTFTFTYLATNESQWESGLMNKKVTDTTFMLFIFPKSAVYPFWMYSVNSSLDIIWVNATGTTGRVVYIAASVPGCSLPVGCPNYTPSSAANYVIEAKGGFASANKVFVGSTIQFG